MKWLETDGSVSAELKSIVNNSNDLVFVKNRAFEYVAASDNFATMCAHCQCADDLIGKTDFDLFPEQLAGDKYREDDEVLFASGKDMMEFREDYVDASGVTHSCYTAKYVLHGEDGEPAALFGQYHEISSEMQDALSRKMYMMQKGSNSLMRTFFVSNYVDLRTHEYWNLWAMDYVREMMHPGESAEKGFETFFRTLVQSEFIPKLREFCDLSTLQVRLDGKNQIDCEYLSNVATGWCRAIFFPTEWDDDGTVTHVLFAVSPVDEGIAKDIEEGRSNKKNLENIFDAVPGGIVLYEWDGKDLKVLRMSRHYRELYGNSLVNDTANPDFQRIHPEDIGDYKKAIAEALITKHSLEYVFRVWDPRQNRYTWTQINAISKPQMDGTQLVYAMYTDVTEQKDAELAAAKRQASLEAALAVSNQVCCEYDPLMHTVNCFTEKNFFNYPSVLYGYPECLQRMDFLHPEDTELFLQTVHDADDGEHETHCDVRAKRDGEYRWFSYFFRPYFDTAKERTIVIVTIIDATLRMNSIRDYENRIQAMLTAKENTLTMCSINLSRDTFTIADYDASLRLPVVDTTSFEKLIMAAVDRIIGEESRKKYRRLFRRESLLQRALEGKMHTEMEYLAMLAPGHYEWVSASVDLVKNPLTNELGGIAYSKSAQNRHMSQALLNNTLQQEYLLSAIIIKDTDEFYMYEASNARFSKVMPNFWGSALKMPQPGISKSDWDYLSVRFEKSVMLKTLDEEGEFSYAYDGTFQGRALRMEIRFRYLDEEQTMILASIRDITDQIRMEQWKYDSEHDALTGLYNRKTTFQYCRELLEKHPEETFIMLHCDVRRFHLYNTFFGEKAGDRLLVRMAEVLSAIAEEYDYVSFGRIESDVFCVFFPLRDDMFEKHVKRCFADVEAFSPEFPLRLAIGAYQVTDPAMSIEEMFTRATIAAKSGATNLFGLIAKFDEGMDWELQRVQEITSEMHGAIANEQFEVYLQPKYALQTEQPVGAEALVRWNHPQRGMIPPGVFIPVFEQNGFIAELDRYMWEHVCRILCRWKEEGRAISPISVNMSRVSLYNPATVPVLIGLVEKYDLDPTWLELELTETAYMDDPEELKHMLQELQRHGFKILMDDFGSGYSSLNTLRELPVDVLKLDMKFLFDLQKDSRGIAVLSSVVRMSKMLHLPIVAEGVETLEQAEYLRRIGCEYVQGFLYARPMPVAEYEALTAKYHPADPQ